MGQRRSRGQRSADASTGGHAHDLLTTNYGHTGHSLEELLHRSYRSRSKLPILLSSAFVSAARNSSIGSSHSPTLPSNSSTNPSPCPTSSARFSNRSTPNCRRQIEQPPVQLAFRNVPTS